MPVHNIGFVEIRTKFEARNRQRTQSFEVARFGASLFCSRFEIGVCHEVTNATPATDFNLCAPHAIRHVSRTFTPGVTCVVRAKSVRQNASNTSKRLGKPLFGSWADIGPAGGAPMSHIPRSPVAQGISVQVSAQREIGGLSASDDQRQSAWCGVTLTYVRGSASGTCRAACSFARFDQPVVCCGGSCHRHDWPAGDP